MEDGIVVFYMDKGIIYPILLAESQLNLIRMVVANMFRGEELIIVRDRPMGEIVIEEQNGEGK